MIGVIHRAEDREHFRGGGAGKIAILVMPQMGGRTQFCAITKSAPT